jgi:chromosomal replication initiation ATPase DnaA|tara:strand:- start:97 stop:606 length:510 start_codon:yes stop_codon:yes gene_type:complete
MDHQIETLEASEAPELNKTYMKTSKRLSNAVASKHSDKLAEYENLVYALRQELETVDIIKEHVAEMYGITPAELSLKTNRRDIVWPRHVGMLLVKKYTSIGLLDIARLFGRTHHATTLHAIKVVEIDISMIPSKLKQVTQINLNILSDGRFQENQGDQEGRPSQTIRRE